MLRSRSTVHQSVELGRGPLGFVFILILFGLLMEENWGIVTISQGLTGRSELTFARSAAVCRDGSISWVVC